MSKEALTLTNFDNGQTMDEVNVLIAAVVGALGGIETEKANGTITITLKLQNADDGGDFIKVTPKVAVKLPQRPASALMFPVQNLGGKRTLVVDSDQVGDQLVIPGAATGGATVRPVANLDERRAAV